MARSGQHGSHRTATAGAPPAVDDGVRGGAGGLTRAPALFPVLVAGVVIGVIEMVLATSFAAIVFEGELSFHLPRAIGVALFAATATLAVLTLTTSLPGAMGSVQDVPAAILGGIGAAVATQVPAASEAAFLTVVLICALSSLLSAGFMLAIGTLRLGNLVRFVPYPVIGGFLGGTGVLLAEGAIGILLAAPFSWLRPAVLLDAAVWLRWLPALIFAAVLVAAQRRGRRVGVVPAGFVLLVAAFYLVARVAGAGPDSLGEGGWLLGPFPDAALWRPWLGTAVTTVDWWVVLGQLPTVAILVVLSALGLLLNASGLELQAGRDIDLDRELRAAGWVNLTSGLGGGLPGYHAVSLSALAQQTGAGRRVTGLVAAGVCGLALIFGGGALSLFPRVAVGGLLLFVGLGLVMEWTYDARLRLPRAEYAVVLLIVAVIAVWGYGAGVVTGLVAAVLLFLTDYSRIDVVKHALTGATYRANIDRSAVEEQYLRDHGDAIHIVELQGFLFFGTANALAERIRRRVDAEDRPRLRFVVLGFRRVTGLDSSAALSFEKIRRLALRKGFFVVLTGLPDAVERSVAQAGLLDGGDTVRVLRDVDHGVQWCEDSLLAAAGGAHDALRGDGRDPLVFGIDLTRLASYLENVEVPTGHVLIRQGDRSEDLFFLEEGYLTVQLETDHGVTRLRAVGPGTIVGELTHYLETPRTATVVAETPCRLYRLSHHALERLEEADPKLALVLHRSLARLMARRIVDGHKTIAALLD